MGVPKGGNNGRGINWSPRAGQTNKLPDRETGSETKVDGGGTDDNMGFTEPVTIHEGTGKPPLALSIHTGADDESIPILEGGRTSMVEETDEADEADTKAEPSITVRS